MYLDDFSGDAVWSPCGKFIAIARQKSTEILDALTLNKLSTFELPPNFHGWHLSFTSDGRFLTRFDARELVSWDVQTGGLLGAVPSTLQQFPHTILSSACSTDGKMIAVAYNSFFEGFDGWHSEGSEDSVNEYFGNGDCEDSNTFIATFDPFGTHIRTCRVPVEPIVPPIWTHGQCFRFATLERSSITIWEVTFASTRGPAEVESLPIPEESAHRKYPLFSPALSQLAYILRDRIRIWDAKASKFLLKSEPIAGFLSYPNLQYPISFGCHFFVCVVSAGAYVWKESPSGYALHQKLTFVVHSIPIMPRLSPNGESIIVPLNSTIHLWPTRDQILPPPYAADGEHHASNFVLGFSPNKLFAAFAQWQGNVVKVLDLQSGDLLSTIDMGVEVYCLGITETTVVAASRGKVVSWALPGENRTSKSGGNIKGSIQTTTPNRSTQRYPPWSNHISLSPNSNRIAITMSHSQRMEIYDVSTGRNLGGIKIPLQLKPRFTLDGRQIWDAENHSTCGFEIVEDSKSGGVELKLLEQTAHPPRVFPLQSPYGYKVSDDGWVLSSTQKRLLWLPQRWRSNWKNRAWSGRFLGLLHLELLEIIILEFLE